MKKLLHFLAIIGIVIVGVIAVVSLFAIVFLKAWKPFGGKASKADRKNYAERAANFDGKKFHNEEDFSAVMDKNAAPDPLTFSKRQPRPDFEFPTKMPDYLSDPENRLPLEEFRVTWFGHSSLLLQMHGMNILIDPVFSEMISPVSWVGSKRFSHPPVSVAQLPEIDILILSHDHYDHLDYDVICEIDPKVKQYIVPLGVENHLKRWKVKAEKITNMAWWEETEINGLTIACTPSQHFSGRKLVDNMTTLWCSWVLKDDYHKIFENGDSGFAPHFEKIHEKYGDFDFALMECGQYDVQWPKVHMFPEQSAHAAKVLGAKVVQPIHWGAIVLSRHGWDDPVERFLLAAEKENLTVITPYIGQTARLETPSLFMERWW
ncbi:MAG: MBL fold metallo-hydrolase [Treponema sp.]|uniref:MBL fold metallo-hydrolase n=1 Tax=Treponema sp. TaxID=166 RepID=UPI0025F7560C|nr:MBL fold metallo-hydrolase [Treponema sp.]MBQ8678304.1 MBL fold metallo-hydrolase [Treponema sp.]